MRNLQSWIRKAWMVLFVALSCAPNMHAQGTAGSITGTVTDPTGVLVPGAAITVTNEGTQATRTAETDSKG